MKYKNSWFLCYFCFNDTQKARKGVSPIRHEDYPLRAINLGYVNLSQMRQHGLHKQCPIALISWLYGYCVSIARVN